MSKTKGHRNCARTKCGACSGHRALRKRELNPTSLKTTIAENSEVIAAVGTVSRDVWEEEYACLRLRVEDE